MKPKPEKRYIQNVLVVIIYVLTIFATASCLGQKNTPSNPSPMGEAAILLVKCR